MKPYPDLMIDLETLSTQPDAVVLQVGWVFFDRYAGERIMFERGWYLDVDEQVNMGRHIDMATVHWWMDQPNYQAQRTAERQSLSDAMAEMNEIWNSAATSHTQVWAKGVSFDIGIWRTLLPEFWSFRNIQCLRTAKLLAADMGVTVHNENSNPHDAVADARSQAKEVQAICSILRRDE